jgi:hypothetical protein
MKTITTVKMTESKIIYLDELTKDELIELLENSNNSKKEMM